MASYFSKSSCTRFSPMTLTPQRMASLMHSGGTVLVAATSVTPGPTAARDCFDALAERGILVPQFRIFPSYRSRPDTTTASYSESCFLSTVGRPSSIGISQIYIPSSS